MKIGRIRHTLGEMAVAAAGHRREGVEAPMELLLEDCPGEADETRLKYVLLAIQQRVPDPELVNVVISGDFLGSVQDRSHDRREQAGYDVERLFGTVGAKTINSKESLEATILIAWEAFNSLPEAVLYRLSAREACMAPCTKTRRCHAAPAPGARCLFGRQPVYDAVIGAFHRTNLLFAHAAAEELATDGKIAPQFPPQDQRRLIGGCYDEFRDTLARIAPASTPAGLWAALAGAAIDEYRIERALADQELILEPTHCSSIPQTFTRHEQQMGDAGRGD